MGGRTEPLPHSGSLAGVSAWRKRDERCHHSEAEGWGVFTTTSDKSLRDIARLLAQHTIGSLVIVGDNDKIAGIMSERDLMRAISQGGGEVLTEPVSDFMTKTVMTAGKADTINQLMSEINQLMSEMTIRQFRHMPVAERDRLIGLVSIGDLVKIQIAKIEMDAAATRKYTGVGGLNNSKRNRHNETIARI